MYKKINVLTGFLLVTVIFFGFVVYHQAEVLFKHYSISSQESQMQASVETLIEARPLETPYRNRGFATVLANYQISVVGRSAVGADTEHLKVRHSWPYSHFLVPSQKVEVYSVGPHEWILASAVDFWIAPSIWFIISFGVFCGNAFLLALIFMGRNKSVSAEVSIQVKNETLNQYSTKKAQMIILFCIIAGGLIWYLTEYFRAV